MELPDSALIFVDAWIAVVDKPPGLPVHATPDPQRDHLQAAVGRLLARRGHQPADVGVAHRLDVGTSGLVVLGRTPDMTAELGALFAGRAVHKTYLALTHRADPLPQGPLDVRNHLAPGKRNDWPMVAVRSGGDAAWTTLQTLATSAHAVLWQAELHTGRRHQIRAHLAGLHMPLLGDTAYGATPSAPRPMLHAWHLTLPHPNTGTPLSWTCPPPPDFTATVTRLGLTLP